MKKKVTKEIVNSRTETKTSSIVKVYKYPLFTFNNNNTSTFHKDHDLYQKIYKNLNLLILNDIINKYFNIP